MSASVATLAQWHSSPGLTVSSFWHRLECMLNESAIKGWRLLDACDPVVAYDADESAVIAADTNANLVAQPLACKAAARAPVRQLRTMPTTGLALALCGGAVYAYAIDGLRRSVTLHAARATAFDIDGTSLAVCSGHSLVSLYEVVAPPRLVWRVRLPEPTRGVCVRGGHVVAVCASRGYVLASRDGAILASLALPPDAVSLSVEGAPSDDWRAAATMLPVCWTQGLSLLLLVPSTRRPARATAAVWLREDVHQGFRFESISLLGQFGDAIAAQPLLSELVVLQTSSGLIICRCSVEAAGGRLRWDAAHAPCCLPSSAGRGVRVVGLHAVVALGTELHATALVSEGEADALHGRIGALVDAVRSAGALARNLEYACAQLGGELMQCAGHPIGQALASVTRAADESLDTSVVAAKAQLARTARLVGAVASALDDSASFARTAASACASKSPSNAVAGPDKAVNAIVAEAIVFGVAAPRLLRRCELSLADAQSRLRLGAAAALLDVHAALGLHPDARAVLDAPSSGWAVVCDLVLPSTTLCALVELVQTISRAAASYHGRPPSAEELLPCLAYSASTALANGSAPQLLAHLELARTQVETVAEPQRAAYSLSTVEVALEVVGRCSRS